MFSTDSRAATLVWLALIAISLAGYSAGSVPGRRAVLAAALLLTLIKGQLIVDHFMGLRRVRPVWRIMMSAWLVAVGAVVAFTSLSA